jgi:type VI protein secretion system component VasK
MHDTIHQRLTQAAKKLKAARAAKDVVLIDFYSNEIDRLLDTMNKPTKVGV